MPYLPPKRKRGRSFMANVEAKRKKREAEFAAKKSNDNNINNNKMVNARQARIIALDTASVAAIDMVMGKTPTGARVLKFALADTIYEYALKEQFERMTKTQFTSSTSDATDEIGSKAVGLGLSLAAINMAAGQAFNAMNLAIDVGAALGGGMVLNMVVPQVGDPQKENPNSTKR